MDLSKAYDCLRHNFLILKLEAYRLDYNSLTLTLGHQALRKQSIKIGTSYSDWARIFWRIPQGYQENSHPENFHLENSHQSNSPLVNSPREIPTHVFKYSHPGFLIFFVFFIIVTFITDIT